MTTIQRNSAIQSLQLDTGKTVATKPQADSTEKVSGGIRPDQINLSVKKGAGVAFKGAGAGALGTGVATLGTLAVVTKGQLGGEAAILSIPLTLAAALGGAAGGAVAANVTTSKSKGALVGAASGAVFGATTIGALNSWNPQGITAGAVVGGLAGALGGVFGAMTAKNK